MSNDKMKELKVHHTSDLQSFSYNSQENLERSNAGTLPVGRISCRGDLAYLARGTALEIVNASDGSRRSACNLGAVRDNVKINCIQEFPVGESRKLLLGLEVTGWKRNGLLCVYDMAMAKVIRAIWVPQAVTVISLIQGAAEMDSVISGLSFGNCGDLVIVGCSGGQVLIVKIGEIKPYDQRNDMSFPADLDFIKLQNLEEMDPNKGTDYCIDLSADFCSDASFRYLDGAGRPIRVFKRGNVAVTSLLHMKQSALLVAGYNFGCFQIWDLQSMQAIFSSSYDPTAADLTHLVFQEPENDPRHCCYLLAGRSPSALPSTTTNINAQTTISLYQLAFEFKEPSNGGGFLYRELEAVCKRFEHQLTSDSNHLAEMYSVGSRIISCSSLATEIKQQKLDQSIGSHGDIDGKHMDTTLSYVVWESPPAEPEKVHSNYHLGLFDMNRWYQLQMPESVGDAMYGRSDPVCPFFAFYSLGEVAETIVPDALVDCYIDVKDVCGFKCPLYPSLEQNFWPSALAFKCTCLAERGLVKTEMLGMQRQILADLVSKGCDAFNMGYQLVNLCWSAGLVPKHDLSRLDDTKDSQVQFDCLMTIAIEHNLMSFIMRCVREWSRGEITNAGMSLRYALQWAWKRVIKAKGMLDEYYIPVFYSNTPTLDDEIIRNLSHCADELARLVQIMSALKDSHVAITDEGSTNLQIKFTVTRCIAQYAEAILFFIRSGILPETSENATGPKREKSLLCDHIMNHYDRKRMEIGDSSSVVEGSILFIDGYCKVLEEKITENDNDNEFGWDGRYPPPSVNTVCKSLLLDIPREEVIEFIYYWILDAAEFLKNDKLAGDAACSFHISKTRKNIIEAQWNIDHGLFEVGIEKLMEHGPELLPEAMKVVYYYGNKSLACGIYKAKEMLSTGNMDWKLCIQIMVENQAIYEAYNLQGKYRDSPVGYELYHHFLELCLKNNVMFKLFDFHLTDEDEGWLYDFLENHTDPTARENLVIFCIKRHRYAEAIRLGADFEKEHKVYKEQSLFGSLPSRRAIMHMSDQIILPIQRKLVSFPYQFVNREAQRIKEVTRPEPLSAAMVKKGSVNISSQSDTIFKILHSVEANRSTPERIFGEESFNLPFVRSAKSSMSVSRKRREYNQSLSRAKDNTPKFPKPMIPKPIITEEPKSDIPLKRRKHLFYGAEAMKLLTTPPVIKNPSHFKQIRSHRTPASILKPRKATDKKDATGKSVRKRVVISDPNISISPVKLPDSPVKVPESPTCLTNEVFKDVNTGEKKDLDNAEQSDIVSDDPAVSVSSHLGDVKRSLDSELGLGDSEDNEDLAKEPAHSITEDAVARDITSTEPATVKWAVEGFSSSVVIIDQQIIDQSPITKEESVQSVCDDVAADEDGEIFFKTKVRFDLDNAAEKEASPESGSSEKSLPEDRVEIETDEIIPDTTPIILDDDEDETAGEGLGTAQDPKTAQEELDYEASTSEEILAEKFEETEEHDDVIITDEDEDHNDVAISQEAEEHDEVIVTDDKEEHNNFVVTQETEENESVAIIVETEEHDDVVISEETEENEDVEIIDETEEQGEVVISEETEEHEEVIVTDETEEHGDIVVSEGTEEHDDEIIIYELEEHDDVVTSHETEEHDDVVSLGTEEHGDVIINEGTEEYDDVAINEAIVISGSQVDQGINESIGDHDILAASDITVSLFEDKHGLSMHEDNNLPNLASEILVAEQVDVDSALSTEIAYVSQERSSARNDDVETVIVLSHGDAATQDFQETLPTSVIQSTMNDVNERPIQAADEFVLELDSDSNGSLEVKAEVAPEKAELETEATELETETTELETETKVEVPAIQENIETETAKAEVKNEDETKGEQLENKAEDEACQVMEMSGSDDDRKDEIMRQKYYLRSLNLEINPSASIKPETSPSEFFTPGSSVCSTERFFGETETGLGQASTDLDVIDSDVGRQYTDVGHVKTGDDNDYTGMNETDAGAGHSLIDSSQSDLDTPDSDFRIRAKDFTKPESSSANSELSMSSIRDPNADNRKAVEEMMKQGRGDLKIFVDKTDVTSNMKYFDLSFESQGSSFVSSPTMQTAEFEAESLDFSSIVEERGASPPKQAKISTEKTRITTRNKGRRNEVRPLSPVKKKSLSATKGKKPSFHAPKLLSPMEMAGYTPPVTRNSAKKDTPVTRPSSQKNTPVSRLSAKQGTPITRSASIKMLQEIGENSLLSSTSISESPISFVPTTDPTTKTLRRRSSRRSLQSPLVTSSVQPHRMTLRSRTKGNTPDQLYK